MFYDIRFSCCFWLNPKVPFFCLDAKEPKNQGCVCFATRSLHFAVRIANSLRSNSDAPGRSVPVVRLTLTRRGQSPSPSPSALVPYSIGFVLFNRICNPIVLSIRIFNPVIRYCNLSPLRGAPLQQGSFFKS